ncbi:MAG TPA: tetratricopeptide repeat protein [Bryobacteraceae bacterium]|nr:tetratricopeptide repeat protein [Bryobacteraceae bacterium]
MLSLTDSKVRRAAIAFALAVALAACHKNPESYIARGRAALDAGKYAEAEIDYLKATQLNGALADAWYGVALAQFREKKLSDAYQNMTHASELAPRRDDISAGLADISIAGYLADPSHPGQLYNQAQAAATDLLNRNPKSWDGLRLKGLLDMLDHRYADAIAAFRAAEQVKAGRNEVTQPLMEALIANGQGAEAEKKGREYLAHDAHFGPIYDTLYRWYMQSHNEPAAEKLLKDKIAANPGIQDYRLQLASHYLTAKKPAEMNAALRAMVEDAKDFPDGNMAAANFCAANALYTDALGYLAAGEKTSSDKPKYRQRTAEVLAQTGKPDQAMAVLNEILKGDPHNVEARSLRAGIEVESNNPDRIQSALQELTDLLKEKPSDATLHYYLGRAHAAQGDTEAALPQFEEAMRENPGLVQARILAANISMQRGDFQRASQYGDEIVRLTRGNPQARLLRASALTGLGNFDQAQREIDQLEREYPRAAEPRLQFAALRIAQKKYGEAEAIYRALRAANPRDLRPLQGMVEMYEAQNRYDAAIDVLKQEKAKGPSPQVDALLADVALRGNKLDLAVASYTQMAAGNPGVPFAHLRLGDAYMRKGDLGDAVKELQKAKSLAPHDPQTNAMLALALHNAGRGDEAARAYRDALALESGNPLVANNLAYLMAENGGNLDEALRLAQTASREQPANQAIADTVGWIYLKKNLPDSAIQVLSNAARKDPRPLYRYHLAMALYQKGDRDGARRECQAALAGRPPQAEEKEIRELLSKVS